MVGVRNAQAWTHTAWQFHPGDYLVVAIFICTTVVPVSGYYRMSLNNDLQRPQSCML
jgi:uncharacterized membrane protein